LKLAEKIAVVTGAGRGIGRAIALQLAAEGAHVVCWDVDAQMATQTAEMVQELGRQALSSRVDVTDLEAVSAAAQEVMAKFGRVDILVNNAGIARDNLLVRMTSEEWDGVLDINLKGSFYCTKVLAREMMRQRSGRIVNIASVVGVMGNAGQANYCASKAGLIGFTKAVAKELASRGITANAVAPGFIETEMTQRLSDQNKKVFLQAIPLGRFGLPQDVARVVCFLAAEDAGYITGQVVHVDGGMLM
jgi:3-oxoacyl-[acyl-carrier protein] reductase